MKKLSFSPHTLPNKHIILPRNLNVNSLITYAALIGSTVLTWQGTVKIHRQMERRPSCITKHPQNQSFDQFYPSFIGPPTYSLTKILVLVLGPLKRKNVFTVKIIAHSFLCERTSLGRLTFGVNLIFRPCSQMSLQLWQWKWWVLNLNKTSVKNHAQQ